MPRNASGEYTLPAGNPVVSNTLIEIAWANPTMADIGAAITDSLDRYGRGGMLAAFKIADGIVTAPGLSFLAQTNMGLYRAGVDQLGFAVGAVQKLLLTAALASFRIPVAVAADGSVPQLQISNTVNNAASSALLTRYAGNNTGPALFFAKVKASSGFAAVVNNDQIGTVVFGGGDGVDAAGAGVFVRGLAAENWSAAAHGGRLELQTTTIGTVLAPVTRLALSSLGVSFMGGSTLATIDAGSYTPVLTGVTNITSVTPNANTRWTRIGDIVFVSGTAQVNCTAAAALASFGMSLPIAAPGLASFQQLGGAGAHNTNNPVATTISGDTVAKRATISFTANSAAPQTFTFAFSYIVV